MAWRRSTHMCKLQKYKAQKSFAGFSGLVALVLKPQISISFAQQKLVWADLSQVYLNGRASRASYGFACVAQSPKVPGSIPAPTNFFFFLFFWCLSFLVWGQKNVKKILKNIPGPRNGPQMIVEFFGIFLGLFWKIFFFFFLRPPAVPKNFYNDC